MRLEEDIRELDRTGKWNPTFQMLHLDTRQMIEDLTTATAKLPQNRALNRYRDVLPYDHTRVKLKTGRHDYINANFVEVPKVKRKYILAQGPLPSTSEDFWRMVWENDSKAIIMLNRIVEKNVIKCHPYWPMGESEELEFGDFTISNYNCEMRSSFIIRELLVMNSVSDESRVIKQFHYVTWPDFGVPSEPEAFLEFLDEIKASDVLDPNAPPIVHCSAGIGRSGTFCLVDSALELAALNNSIENIDPHQMLLSMRRYRCGLVQTAEQLRFANIAIVYGLYALFPELVENLDAHAEGENGTNGDASDVDDNDNDSIPPPLPPRRNKDTHSASPAPTAKRVSEQDDEEQVKAWRRIHDLESSGDDGSSDEEIIDLSDNSSDDIPHESEYTSINEADAYTRVINKNERNDDDEESDDVIEPPIIDTSNAEKEEPMVDAESSNTLLRRREIETKKREIEAKKKKTRELVENIKKNMKENEGKYLPTSFWKYAGITVGVTSLLFLAYQLYS